MRSTMVYLAVFVLFTLSPAVQAADQEKELIEKYLEAKERKGRSVTEDVYRTPDIYGTERPALTPGEIRTDDSIRTQRRGNLPIGRKGSQLQLFGFDLFKQPSSEFFVPSEAPVPESYVLGPGDEILVNLWGRVEKTYQLTIDREGKVFIPKSGEITLWGLTIKQAEERLAKLLSKIYTEFQLSLVLGKIKSIKVYVYGEVKKPGAYTVSSLATLFNVLYLSGGPALNGSLRRIQLSRSNSTDNRGVDLYDLLIHGRRSDVRLANNDVIFIPVVARTAAIKGRVRRPAIYELLGGETVSDLIALAGGLESDAYLERVLLTRIQDNSRRILIDVNLKSSEDGSSNMSVQDGDTVEVFSIYDFRENFVELAGWVKYAGAFEFKPGMTISDLIDDGKRLRFDSYRKRANLIRIYDDLKKRIIPVDLSAALNGDSTANLELTERDQLIVYYEGDIRRVPYVSIEGEVRREETFELTKDMRLTDLLFLAGGLKKSAYRLGAEIARTDGEGTSRILRANLESCLKDPGGKDDLLLREDDKVFIREIPEWKIHDLVLIEGEVRFPGRYALRKKVERLSELVERAGGFTDRAFLRGAVFERTSIVEDLHRRNLTGIMRNLQEVTVDSLEIALQAKQLRSLQPEQMKRIVVDLVKLFEEGDTSQDIKLRHGDRIFIPEIPSGVHVLGAVASTGTIQYLPSKNYHFYIRQAGGFVKSADQREIRVVKPDGRVFKSNLSKIEIELGDSIVIPKKIVRDRDWWKIFTNSFAILSSAVTTAYLIIKL